MNDNLPVIARNIRVRRSVPEAAAIPQPDKYPPMHLAFAGSLFLAIGFCSLLFGIPVT